MNGRPGAAMARLLRRPSRPQHASAPFRIPPSATANTASRNLIESTSQSATLSRRALSSTLRSQTHQSTLRAALACEGSSLRYALMLEGEGEEALLRGWDAGVAVEDEDGT
ncbi:hypothetical protein ACHAXT_008584 [Thalassiosira profunda]